jgi:hypothetical protein
MVFKNKIPATSVRQKPFSKLSHVAHIKWLSTIFIKLLKDRTGDQRGAE